MILIKRLEKGGNKKSGKTSFFLIVKTNTFKKEMNCTDYLICETSKNIS